MTEVLFFPLKNEQGFKVVDADTYRHMINTIIENTVVLQQEFPENPIFVVYEVGDDK